MRRTPWRDGGLPLYSEAMSSPHADPDVAAPAGAVEGLDPRRRRAAFRAWHRGIREMDLIMGRFADREMARLSEAELSAFEALMERPDPQVYDWITGREKLPGDVDAGLIARLRAYRG